MRRILVTALLVFAVAPVAASVAAGGTDATKAASATCAATKAKLGATTFAQAYTSFGACVSAMTSLEQQNIASAQVSCTAEQADTVGFASLHGGKTFAQFYGKNSSGANALGKCVSATSSAADHALLAATIAAAKSCKTERADRAAFATNYGANENAFGKCVSSKVKTTPTPYPEFGSRGGRCGACPEPF